MANNPEKRTSPIPIANSRGPRHRSASMSSSDSSPASPPSELPTPTSGPYSPKVTIPSPGSSPILSYFLAQSPTGKAPGTATFPFRKFGTAPVFEEEEPEQTHAARHARRASTTMSDRFMQPNGGVPDNQLERGTGLLRRLSLSTGPPSFNRPPMPGSGSPPAAPPNSAVSPPAQGLPFSQAPTKTRRSATLTAETKPRRAPSPMGERILKGHFDGFN